MRKTKVEIKVYRNYKTEVFVNGRFVYQSSCPSDTEKKQIKKLITLLHVKNAIVKVIEK